MPAKALALFQRIHTEINRALWAGLAASLIFFAIFTLPYIKKNQSAAQAVAAAEISAENDMYCKRWNFVPGTGKYRSCLDDLSALRMSIQKKLAEDSLL